MSPAIKNKMDSELPLARKGITLLENQKKLIYLDNAATTQKPQEVLDAMNKFYREINEI